MKAASQCSRGIKHPRQQDGTAHTFDEHGHQQLVSGALDEIALPAARHKTIVDPERAHVDGDESVANEQNYFAGVMNSPLTP
ncbi:hypothetical protein ABIC51_006846 [Burkholderia sp. 572]